MSNIFFKSDKQNDVYYMKWKFIIMAGEYEDTYFWNNQTIEGGKRDKNGQSKGAVITGRMARQIIESARGINKEDKSPEAAAARILQNDWLDLDEIVFLGKVGVEPATGGYPEKNKLVSGIMPGHKDWYEWRSNSGQAMAQAPAAAQTQTGGLSGSGTLPAASAGGMGFTKPPDAPAGGGAAPASGERPEWADV